MTPRWQTTSAGRSPALRDVDERGDDALLLLGQRLAAGEAEVLARLPERRPGLGLVALEVVLVAALPVADVAPP